MLTPCHAILDIEKMMNIEDLNLECKITKSCDERKNKKNLKKMFVNFGGLSLKKKKRVLLILFVLL
jgi:hypothetical protein